MMGTAPLARSAPPPIDPPPLSRPSPAKRRRASAAERLLEASWRRGVFPVPVLEPDHLIRAACDVTGLPADDGCWRERLCALTQAIANEAALNSLGHTIAYGQLVMALKHRLWWQALWRKHPQIAQFPIEAPILIVGQMRSGTTRMQRLLACDPRLTFTRFFESWTPFSADPASRLDTRPMSAWLGLRCAHLLNPAFRHIHPATATQADEEIGLQNISIFGAAFEAQWRIPSFARHLENADTCPVYAEFRQMLQTLGWLRRNRGAQPWVLKLPQFAQDMGAVLATFPDARIVRLTRDPVRVVASSASLVLNQMSLQSDVVCAAQVGREWLRKTSLRERRMRTSLSRACTPQVEVGYEALGCDWRREMTRIYHALGLTWEKGVERRMAAFLSASRHRQLSRHRYDLADFALQPRDVHEALTIAS